MNKRDYDNQRVVNRFTGFAARYHQYRPSPPTEIREVLCNLACTPKPGLVVDLGCGTGKSTAFWQGMADSIYGIDPSADMINFARMRYEHPGMIFKQGFGHDTGIPDQSADIITCSHSIHWMEPKITFSEFGRILRKGGVFAAYGPQVPFLALDAWQVAIAFNDFNNMVKDLDKDDQGNNKIKTWKWAEISAYAKQCGIFRYTDELCFCKTIDWNADDFINWVKTFSYVHFYIGSGNTLFDAAFEKFSQTVTKLLNADQHRFFISYRMLTGII